jgi:hypothetical protein
MTIAVVEIAITLGEALVGTAVVLGEFTVVTRPEVSSSILGEITAMHVWPIAHAVHLRPISAHRVRPVSAHTVRSTGTTTTTTTTTAAPTATSRVSYESQIVLV